MPLKLALEGLAPGPLEHGQGPSPCMLAAEGWLPLPSQRRLHSRASNFLVTSFSDAGPAATTNVAQPTGEQQSWLAQRMAELKDMASKAAGGLFFESSLFPSKGAADAKMANEQMILSGIQAPCDPRGRIPTAPDGVHCAGGDVCVTSLPQDFGYDPQYAGRPFCVPPAAVSAYPGPLEIQCSASGKGALDKSSPTGQATGCWWLRQFVGKTEDLQRLAGRQFTGGPDGWTRQQAEAWATKGVLPPVTPMPQAQFF